MIISDMNTSSKVVVTCKVYTIWSPLSHQQSGVESWQCALLSVERGLLTLDWRRALRKGDVLALSKAGVKDSHPHTQTRCLLESWHIQRKQASHLPHVTCHHLSSILYLYSSACMRRSLLMKASVGSRNV